MLFNSYIFVLFFLPVALIGYYGLNYFGKYQTGKVFLTGMSLWFYAYFEPSYLLIILSSVVLNYLVSKLVQKASLIVSVRKLCLILGVCFDVGIIFYYKYFDFVLGNIHTLFGSDYVARNILMPLGISFFTFQQISYLVDAWRGETKGYSFLDYVLFVTFFPQLIAGPIVFHEETIPAFNDKSRKKLNQEKLAEGIWLFSVGLFKKVLIADTLGKGADYGFSCIGQLSSIEAVLVMLSYTLQLYFDFSGYCDMAVGVGKMFQIELPINFNSPYKAVSVTEFWSRWHITLTRFLRKYVYFPLGGNRKGKVRTLVNIFLVYLISGIWHGAAWTFVLWGVVHGLVRIIERVAEPVFAKIPKAIRFAGTFLFINLAWVLFRASSLGEAVLFYQQLFTGWDMPVHGGLFEQFAVLEFTYIVEHIGVLSSFVGKFPWIYTVVVLFTALLIALGFKNCHEKVFCPTLGKAIGSIVLLVWSVMSFSGISAFLYFNF